MRGQNEEALDDRKEQHGNHDEGDEAEDLSHHARNEEQWRKGGDGREHGESHRDSHFSRAFDCSRHRAFAGLHFVEGVFTDDDRIIHHEPERDDECEKRDHVDAADKAVIARDQIIEELSTKLKQIGGMN